MNARGWIVADTVGDDVDESASYPMHSIGTASTLGREAGDPAAEVRRIAREVTGKDFPDPVKPHIGFLP